MWRHFVGIISMQDKQALGKPSTTIQYIPSKQYPLTNSPSYTIEDAKNLVITKHGGGSYSLDRKYVKIWRKAARIWFVEISAPGYTPTYMAVFHIDTYYEPAVISTKHPYWAKGFLGSDT